MVQGWDDATIKRMLHANTCDCAWCLLVDKTCHEELARRRAEQPFLTITLPGELCLDPQ